MNWILHIFDPATIGGLFTQFQSEVQHPQFWVALTKIIWINVLLSGDNALVIALACRGLQPRQRMWGMILGAGVAVALRIVFTGIVATLMELPYLKLIGGLALIVIAAKLLVPEDTDEDNVQAAQHLWAAVRIVAVADIIMSLDNVIAVAAAANGSFVLLILGLAISVPMIVAGAALIMALLDKLPALVWLGAALLGWIAGRCDCHRSGSASVSATSAERSDRAQHGCDIIDLGLRQTDQVRRKHRRVRCGTARRHHRADRGIVWRGRALRHAAVPSEA